MHNEVNGTAIKTPILTRPPMLFTTAINIRSTTEKAKFFFAV